ncbi:hypothetical protein LCGC14_2459350, partial [marine sediment metagenome]
ALCVVMASGGYPGQYENGLEIRGLPDEAGRDDLTVFHAGTKKRAGKIVTAGGRVLGVTALGATPAEARTVAYDAVERIRFENAQYRRDLGSAAPGASQGIASCSPSATSTSTSATSSAP